MDLPLTTINSDIALAICADECGSKCCDFYLNDFHARVNIEDYKRLVDHNLADFVIWDHGDPQLAKQPGGECVFLHPNTKACTIYKARPLDCRNFPYFMQEEDIPNHCLLYHRSSQQLIQDEREKTHDVPNFDKSYDELDEVEREYINYLQQQPAVGIDHLAYEEVIASNTAYISITYDTDEDLEVAKKLVEHYQQTLLSDYRVISVLGVDTTASEFSSTYHILGIIRASPSVEIDQLTDFPSSIDEVEEVLEYVNYHNYQRLIAGFMMSQDNYQLLQQLIS